MTAVKGGGRQGVPMGAVEYSPARRKRTRRARRRQEERWAARSGPVTVTRIPGPEADPEGGEPHA